MDNVSDCVFKYIGYIATILFIVYFLAKMFEYNDGRLFDAVGISSNKIEGMSVKDQDKAKKMSEKIDLWMDNFEEEEVKKEKEYMEKIPQELKDSVDDLIELFNTAPLRRKKEEIYKAATNASDARHAIGSISLIIDKMLKTPHGMSLWNKLTKSSVKPAKKSSGW